MRKHTKIYLDYYGYKVAQEITCEACPSVAVDIHHISPRGMGGNPEKDVIENLMALCRDCHDKAESGELTREQLTEIHIRNL